MYFGGKELIWRSDGVLICGKIRRDEKAHGKKSRGNGVSNVMDGGMKIVSGLNVEIPM